MADFATTITDAGVLDADEVLAYPRQLILAAVPRLVVDQLVTRRESGAVKTHSFAKYAALDAATALSDGVDPDSTAMADSAVTLTPVEEGNVITLARFADVQSNMKAGLAASILIGDNAGVTADKRAMQVLEAFSTTVIWPNSISATTNLTLNDLLDGKFAGRLFNKLNRGNVPGINGQYFGVAHDDALNDLREDTAGGGWLDVGRYADAQSVMRNEVGMYKGIRWLNSGSVTISDGGGSGAIDSYPVAVLGYDALGYASSVPIQLKVTGPFDKLGRFPNIGWFGIFIYGVINTGNMVLGHTASTVGANT